MRQPIVTLGVRFGGLLLFLLLARPAYAPPPDFWFTTDRVVPGELVEGTPPVPQSVNLIAQPALGAAVAELHASAVARPAPIDAGLSDPGLGLGYLMRGIQAARSLTGAKGSAVYYPFGGFDPHTPLTLVDVARDVFVQGGDRFGSGEDLAKLLGALAGKDRAAAIPGAYDAVPVLDDLRKEHGVSGLGALAIARAHQVLDGEVVMVAPFTLGESGKAVFSAAAAADPKQVHDNALVVFRDRKSGQLKRFWYFREVLGEDPSAAERNQRFVDRLKFDVLLLKAPMNVFDGLPRAERARAIHLALDPARRNDALVVTDNRLRLDFNRTEYPRAHPIWLKKVAENWSLLPARTSFGYPNNIGPAVFWGRGRDLITADTPIGRIRGFYGGFPEYGWLADTCRVLYARVRKALGH